MVQETGDVKEEDI